MSNEILIFDDNYDYHIITKMYKDFKEHRVTFSPESPIGRATKSLTKPFYIKRICRYSGEDLVRVIYYAVFESEKDALEQSFKLNIS